MAKKPSLFSWYKFWLSELLSATVEDTDKEVIMVLFKEPEDIKVFTNSVPVDFTSIETNRSCAMITKYATQGGSGYHLLALTMNSPYAFGDEITLLHNPLALKGTTTSITVTNNIIDD
jgi:hypothetical protein